MNAGDVMFSLVYSSVPESVAVDKIKLGKNILN